MKWNKVSETGFPQIEKVGETRLCLCAVFNDFRKRYDTCIMYYEKRIIRGKNVERWRYYSTDNIYSSPEKIVAWATIPVYNPDQGRLIDADALIEALPETHVPMFENCRECTAMTKEDVIEIIKNQPTAE